MHIPVKEDKGINTRSTLTFTRQQQRGRLGRHRMIIGFTTTCAISAYNHYSCEFEPCSWRGVLDTTLYDKFVSDLRQVGGFLGVLRFPPSIKLTATIITEILLKAALPTINQTNRRQQKIKVQESYSSKMPSMLKVIKLDCTYQ